MAALILFSHGSLLCGAGETLHAHARRIAESGRYARVEVGFMNYSEPTFGEAVARCAAAGVTDAVVVPYFLVPGKFVSVDLRKHVDAARALHPEIRFRVGEAIGFDERIADALLNLATSASPSGWRADLERASHFCLASPTCPLFGTPRCPAPGVA